MVLIKEILQAVIPIIDASDWIVRQLVIGLMAFARLFDPIANLLGFGDKPAAPAETPQLADILKMNTASNGKKLPGAMELGSKEAYSAAKGNQSVLESIADNTKRMAEAMERGTPHSDPEDVGTM